MSKNLIKIISPLAIGTLLLTSCSMFYGKATPANKPISGSEKPTENPKTTTVSAASDIAVTTFLKANAQQFLLNESLSYDITVDSVKEGSEALAFGNEFSLTNQDKASIKARVLFQTSKDENSVLVSLKVPESIEIDNEKCELEIKASKSLNSDQAKTYNCDLGEAWTTNSKYNLTAISAATGLKLTLTGDNGSFEAGSLELPSIGESFKLDPSIKAFTHNLKELKSCDDLPEAKVTFSAPFLDDDNTKQDSNGSTINVCSKKLNITCSENKCSHSIGS